MTKYYEKCRYLHSITEINSLECIYMFNLEKRIGEAGDSQKVTAMPLFSCS